MAHRPAIILRGLSDHAVTIHCLSVDKQTHLRTCAHTCEHTCAHTTSIVLQFCLVNRAESRRVFPRQGPTGREGEAFGRTWRLLPFTSICTEGGCFQPSHSLAALRLHHHAAYAFWWERQQALTMHAMCVRPQIPTTLLKCVFCFFHVAMGVESLSEGMNVAPRRSCSLKTQPGSQSSRCKRNKQCYPCTFHLSQSI